MSQFRKAEIHTHSTFSDGEFHPEKLATLCHEQGVTFWSLTDHDTCAGCGLAAKAAETLGIDFIPGIEISAFEGRSVHVLGYAMDLTNGVIERYSKKRIALREERMQEMLDLLTADDMPVSLDEVMERSGEGAVGRPHLAQTLAAKGHATSVQDAFDRLIGNDGPYYRETPWPSVPEAINIIHDAGGKAILAHPGIYDLDDRIGTWVDAGLDGIECDHPRHNDAVARRYHEAAKKHGVRATASSDFHGLGRTGGDRFGTVEVARELLTWLRE